MQVDTLGRLDGMGINTPSPSIDRAFFSGSVSPYSMAIDSLVIFAGGGGAAEGILTMTR